MGTSDDPQPSSPSSSPAQQYHHPSFTSDPNTATAGSIRQIHNTEAQQIPEPEAAHIPDGITEHEREATELQQQPRHRSDVQRPLSRVLSPSLASEHIYFITPLKSFWRHHVRLSVPHVDCRDHLANERTFLGYLRTSVAFSMIGVFIAQLWRLQHSPTPDPTFGYYVLSIPVSIIFQCAALVMVLLGAVRYWRQQEAMAVGRVWAGGWEMGVIAVGSLLVSHS